MVGISYIIRATVKTFLEWHRPTSRDKTQWADSLRALGEGGAGENWSPFALTSAPQAQFRPVLASVRQIHLRFCLQVMWSSKGKVEKVKSKTCCRRAWVIVSTWNWKSNSQTTHSSTESGLRAVKSGPSSSVHPPSISIQQDEDRSNTSGCEDNDRKIWSRPTVSHT